MRAFPSVAGKTLTGIRGYDRSSGTFFLLPRETVKRFHDPPGLQIFGDERSTDDVSSDADARPDAMIATGSARRPAIGPVI